LARIAGVPAGEAGIGVKLAYYFTPRGIAKLAGLETEQMLESLSLDLRALSEAAGRLRKARARDRQAQQRRAAPERPGGVTGPSQRRREFCLSVTAHARVVARRLVSVEASRLDRLGEEFEQQFEIGVARPGRSVVPVCREVGVTR
jgi:hypothetical protein